MAGLDPRPWCPPELPPWLLLSPSLLDPGPLLRLLLAPPSDCVSSGGGCSASESESQEGMCAYQVLHPQKHATSPA